VPALQCAISPTPAKRCESRLNKFHGLRAPYPQ
jgi:hypothetical protein